MHRGQPVWGISLEVAGFIFWSAKQTTVHGKQTKEEKMAAGHEEKEKAMQSGAESRACFLRSWMCQWKG